MHNSRRISVFPTVPLVCSLVLQAFLEEVTFRGLLRPRLLSRYGILRGMFLDGLVWAAWHFGGDFYVRYSDYSDVGAFVSLTLRVLLCVAMGIVLGWLTIRTESILPATVAHATFNSFAELSLRGSGRPGKCSVPSY